MIRADGSIDVGSKVIAGTVLALAGALALAAWAGDKSIGDEQFLIAAYQASQIYGIGINAENWALTFGGEQLRNIDDPQLRRNLQLVLT